jgi:hypothetical protein
VVPDAQFGQGLLPCYIATPSACGSNPGQYVTVPNLKKGMLPFANSFWPAPNGQELLNANGLPTGTAYAISNPALAVREDFGLIRFDLIASNKDSFSVNYLIDDGDKTQPQADTVFVQLTRPRSQVLSLQETHVFSPTLLNSLNAGFTRGYAPAVVQPVTPFPASLSFVQGRIPGQITIGGGQSTASAAAIVVANGNAQTQNALNLFTESDDVRWTRGTHSFSFGGWLQRVQENHSGPAQNISGTVAYPTLLAFLQDSPTAFNTNIIVTPVGYRQWEGAWYVQDEVKVKPNLTVNIGLRDEMTNGWNEVAGRCSNLLFDKNAVVLTNTLYGSQCFTENNAKRLFQPRLGVAWDPTGKGTWAVRAGVGMYNNLQDNQAFRLDSNPPTNPRLVLQGGPMLPQIPLVPPATGFAGLPPVCNEQLVLAKANCSIYSVNGVDPTMHTPTVIQWSFALERQITTNLAVQLSYVGSEGYHMLIPGSLNAPYPQVCNNQAGCLSGGVGRPVATVPQGTTYLPPVTGPGFVLGTATAASTCAGPNGTRIPCYPNPFVGKVVEQLFAGTTSYNGFNVSLVKRASRGLTFRTNYTFSKAFDYNSANSSNGATNQTKSILNVYDLKLSKGIAAFNLRHQFNANFAYQLPFGQGQPLGSNAKGWVNQLIGGWQWNGIIAAQSGFPWTPQVGANTSGNGDTDNPDVPNYNPAFRGPIILGTDGFKKTGKYFDPAAFIPPVSGTFGDVQRGALTGPRLINFDTSLFKKFALTERLSLQFRAEAFNIFNHVNFGEPNAVIFQGVNAACSVPAATPTCLSSSAGTITSASSSSGLPTATSSRQIQFALRLVF